MVTTKDDMTQHSIKTKASTKVLSKPKNEEKNTNKKMLIENESKYTFQRF